MLPLHKIRYLLAIFFILLVIGIVVAVYNKKTVRVSPEPKSGQLPANIDVALKNAKFNELRNGVPVWELTAEKTEYDQTGEIANLVGVKMQFQKTSFGKITLTAAKAQYSSKTRNVRLRENIRVKTETGVSFETESLDYDSIRSEFNSNDHVFFHQNRLSLQAIGMKLFIDAQKAKFGKQVDATVEGFK